MKSVKKAIVSIGATVAFLSLAATALADTQTKPATGYGTLTGVLSGSAPYTVFETSVSYNTDSAYLTIKGSAQTSSGSTITALSQINSPRGATYFSALSNPLPSNTYTVFGTHGVQGGGTYRSAAVFTYTHL